MEKRDSARTALEVLKTETEALQDDKSLVDDALQTFDAAKEISAKREKAEADLNENPWPPAS